MTYETLKADADGDMVLLRKIARMEMRECNGELSYSEREIFFAAEEAMIGTDVRQVYIAVYENLIETEA